MSMNLRLVYTEYLFKAFPQQTCGPYLQQVQHGSADDPQVSSVQGLGMVHGRELKTKDNSIGKQH